MGRGDLGLGGWDKGGKVGSAGGGTGREGAGGEGGRVRAGSLPLLCSAKCGLQSQSSCHGWRSAAAAVLGEGEGSWRLGGNCIPGVGVTGSSAGLLAQALQTLGT